MRYASFLINVCQLILAIGAAMIISIAVAAVYLPWWAPVALVFIFLFGTRFLFRTVMGSIAKGAAAAVRPQGEILDNARLEIHSLTPVTATPEPRPDEFGDLKDPEKKKADYASRKWYELLLTITPTRPNAQQPEWDPRELKLVVENPKLGDTQVDDGSCVIHQVEVERDGSFHPASDDDLNGAHKLKILIGVRPGVERLRFNYFFNLFGEIKIPK